MERESASVKAVHRVFLSAPLGVDVAPIREALVARGVEVIGADDWSTTSTPISDRIAELVRGADLFIGVLGVELSPTVMYEAGFASGLGKRVVLFLPPSSVELPVDMSGGLYFRLDPSSSNIGFAIDQGGRRTHGGTGSSGTKPRDTREGTHAAHVFTEVAERSCRARGDLSTRLDRLDAERD